MLVNLGTRFGWTRLVKSAHELPPSVRRGFLDEGERRPIGQETVSPIAIAPLTWHIALVLVAYAIAHFVTELTSVVLPGKYKIPMFSLSMIAGACLQMVLDALRVGQYVDRQIMSRIGSCVSDYLIAFGIASINISVVVNYAAPLAIMCVFGMAYAVATFWLLGRKMFHNFWFERSLFAYGWTTGVVAIEITLLRVVDPRLKSSTLGDFALAHVFISSFNIALIITLPALIANDIIVMPAVLLTVASATCILLSRTLVGWFPKGAETSREGEAAVIADEK